MINIVPKSVSRVGYRSALKLRGASPTILVVAGVGGLVATSVLAARATRKIDPILDEHRKGRLEIDENVHVNGLHQKAEQRAITELYLGTSVKLAKLYGPTLFVGSSSALAVLGGHKILRGRQIATLAAYTGLMEQFQLYRGRVIKTLGADVERGLYEGAHGEWDEDPDHKGEYKLKPKFEGDPTYSYLRPWFDEINVNWTRDPVANYLFLKGVQQHMNNVLQIRGHVFLNDVFDALKIPRCKEGSVSGWVRNSETGDNYIDFGFLSSTDPHSIDFCNGLERSVRLNFNIDGMIWDLI